MSLGYCLMAKERNDVKKPLINLLEINDWVRELIAVLNLTAILFWNTYQNSFTPYPSKTLRQSRTESIPLTKLYTSKHPAPWTFRLGARLHTFNLCSLGGELLYLTTSKTQPTHKSGEAKDALYIFCT
jgi:hypothetical protein